MGDRIGQYNIRINNQWRICFEWNEDEVKIYEEVHEHI